MDAIAITSTLISSIALVGIAVSLLLQSRQLRISQLEALRIVQYNLLRMALDNPELIASLVEDRDPESFTKGIFLNWRSKVLELNYEVNAMSADSVRLQAKLMFGGQFSRDWWSETKPIYESEAKTKRQKEFVTLLDEGFEQALQGRGTAG